MDGISLTIPRSLFMNQRPKTCSGHCETYWNNSRSYRQPQTFVKTKINEIHCILPTCINMFDSVYRCIGGVSTYRIHQVEISLLAPPQSGPWIYDRPLFDSPGLLFSSGSTFSVLQLVTHRRDVTSPHSFSTHLLHSLQEFIILFKASASCLCIVLYGWFDSRSEEDWKGPDGEFVKR